MPRQYFIENIFLTHTSLVKHNCVSLWFKNCSGPYGNFYIKFRFNCGALTFVTLFAQLHPSVSIILNVMLYQIVITLTDLYCFCPMPFPAQTCKTVCVCVCVCVYYSTGVAQQYPCVWFYPQPCEMLSQNHYLEMLAHGSVWMCCYSEWVRVRVRVCITNCYRTVIYSLFLSVWFHAAGSHQISSGSVWFQGACFPSV